MTLKINGLGKEEYFLIISKSGDILKTKSEKEFNTIKSWGRIVFSDVVSNNDKIEYTLENDQQLSKWIRFIKNAKPFEKNLYYDLDELDIRRSTIKQCVLKKNQSNKTQEFKT